MKSSERRCTFDELQQALTAWPDGQRAAEVQGLIAGLICGGGRMPTPSLLRLVAEHVGLEQAPSEADGLLLADVYADVLEELSGADLSFEIMMHDDEQSLLDRSNDIHFWCEGFLVGFGTALQQKDSESLSADAQEALQDIVEISQLEPEDEGGPEMDTAIAEISEYLRMAALLLFAEVNQGRESDAADPVVH